MELVGSTSNLECSSLTDTRSKSWGATSGGQTEASASFFPATGYGVAKVSSTVEPNTSQCRPCSRADQRSNISISVPSHTLDLGAPDRDDDVQLTNINGVHFSGTLNS